MRERDAVRRHCRKTNALGAVLAAVVLVVGAAPSAAWAGQSASQPAALARPAGGPAVVVPPDYVIGPADVLGLVFWRDREMSGDVVVRPDGKISLPLLNEVQAAGLTPEQLRVALEQAAKRYVDDPNASVVVRQINSRKVFITGKVTTPGAYPITSPTTVVQLIAVAGGLQEYADDKHIVIVRREGTRSRTYVFNYREVAKGRKLQQDIELKPGDTVIVP